MELKKRPGLVAFVTQSRATFDTFDAERCKKEVVLPARTLLREGAVDNILFVVMCNPTNPPYEVAEDPCWNKGGWIPQGRLPRYVTPTSKYLLEEMRLERSDWLFHYLNIKELTEYLSPIAYAVDFLKRQGSQTRQGTIVCPEGVPIPTPEEVKNTLKYLEGDGVVSYPYSCAGVT